MADLQELLSRLNGGGAGSPQQPQQRHAQSQPYQHPSVSSPIFSPSPSGQQPHHPSAIMSPSTSMANTPVPEQGQTPQQQSAQLLNLLRFNAQPGLGPQRRVSQNSQAPPTPPPHAHPVQATDLSTGFMAPRVAPAAPAAPAAAPSAQASQDLLLRLLNHPKPAQSESRSSRASAAALSPPILPGKPEMATDSFAPDVTDAEPASATAVPSASPMRVFGSDGQGSSTRFQPEPATVAPPKFTYVNPFDQLAAASPRNRTPAPASASVPKMEILKPRHVVEAAATAAAANDDALAANDAASIHPHETVAEAVSDVGEQVSQQIEEALAEAESQSAAGSKDAVVEDVKDAQEAMAAVASALADEVLEAAATTEKLSKPLSAAFNEVAAEVADPDVVENWETAEAEESRAKGEDDQTVTVYKFPMRAFSSIYVKSMPPRNLQFRPELFMDVARLKKEFDQIDRSLVSASKNFIVYAIVKKGGFRIIRQENGKYRQVFENHQERIFNIALCSNGALERSEPLESILGIGVNGTVFWTSLNPEREDQFGENLDSQGLMLPPSPSQDDNTSGGQLKTRAKPSSRHPEFFAVGRGKSIHIVFPRVAASYARPKSRVCHTEKYLKERSLKILTGKAGKDFTFSEDDTVIVSLDKAGRMRFWDIRKLTAPELGFPGSEPKTVEVSNTLLEFNTTTPNAKSWPTSVFFFDKDKPYTKGIALRYVMVGMKQNHAFQLWDLGLSKAVQEINLPHENESDAICSVSFHPRTGIMAIAHPTRNSIFFIHVSCPRYNLPLLSQAAYISCLANPGQKGQPQLPGVNATAIMTSITEYSFASKGQIRSLHMLNDPAGPADVDDPEDAAMFELYVMHSKGVCTLRIRRSDLGWKKEGELMNPKQAEAEGIISIGNIAPTQAVTDESSTAGDTATKSVSDLSVRESAKKEISKPMATMEVPARTPIISKPENKQEPRAATNGSDTPAKKKNKKRAATAAAATSTESASQTSGSSAPAQAASTTAPAPARSVPSSYAQAAQIPHRPKSPATAENPTELEAPTVTDNEAPEWARKLFGKLIQQPATPISAPQVDTQKLEETLTRELGVVSKKMSDDRRVMNAANEAKQEAILRLVSTTLTENVETVIKRMVDDNFRNVLLPEVLAQTSSQLEKSISSNLKTALGPQLSKEVPDAVSRALKSPQLFQSLSDQVAKRISSNFEPMVASSVSSVVTPAFANLSNVIEQQIAEQLRQSHAQRREDSAKISQLTDTVHTCLETIRSMAVAQTELQSQVAKLQKSMVQSTAPAPGPAQANGPKAARSPVKQKTPEELQIDAITQLMQDGEYEQGTMQWLQSNNTAGLFDAIFVRCNPAYLTQVSPLLALSTGAVVSDPLDMNSNLPERINWLEHVFGSVNPNNGEVRDIVPRIMGVISQRLTAAYFSLNEESPGNDLLPRISTLINSCRHMSHAAMSH